ncbi:UNVERIFIED_CONTAM: hypothetical protein Sradi_1893600 [Sesamum radiatum]|uniref:Myb/SANT-like domain-containing protein n=1 Tax=Sesamum radiatum TaxID=300843 RepID=A0AAW2TYG0_SESRA
MHFTSWHAGTMDADYISTAHVNTLKDDGSSREQRRGSNKQRSGPRKTWTIVEEEALVNGLKSLITTGWKCENGFRNGYLAQLEVYMKRLFPQCHIKAEPHTNSKLHVWKKQYSMLTSMMNKSRFGWDESRNMVTVEHENVWQDFVKMYPSSQGMRFKSWLFFPAWKEIFGMDHASGDRSWDPTGRGVEKTQREPPEIQQFNAGTGDWNPDIGFDGINEETPLSQYFNCDPTVNSSSATKRTPGSRKHKSYEPCPRSRSWLVWFPISVKQPTTALGHLRVSLKMSLVIRISVGGYGSR